MRHAKRLTGRILGALLVLAVLAIVVLKVVFTKERILAIVEPQIENRINRDVSIGDASLTLWGGLGARLEDVAVENPAGFSDRPMMTINALDVKARFWPLLTGNVQVDHIELVAPEIAIEYDSMGLANFDGMFKSETADQSEASDNSRRIHIGRIAITDAIVSWQEERNTRSINLHGADAEVRLTEANDRSDAYVLDLQWDSLKYAQGGRRVSIRTGHPSLHAVGRWLRDSRTLHVDSATAKWWGAQWDGRGIVRFLPEAHDIEGTVRLVSARAEELIKEIDAAHPLPKFRELTAGLTGEAEAKLQWPLQDGTIPNWRGRFQMTDVEWNLPESDAVVRVPLITVEGADSTISWTIEKGQYSGGSFSTSGNIEQLFSGSRRFSAHVSAQAALADVSGLLPSSWDMALDGSVDVDMDLAGPVADWKQMTADGRIESSRFVISSRDWDFGSVAMDFACVLSGHRADIQRCNFRAGDSHGRASGSIEQLLPALLTGFGSSETGAIPRGRLDVVGGFISIDQLMGDDSTVTVLAGGEAAEQPFPLLTISGTVRADTLIYNDMVISQASSPYEYANRRLVLSKISGAVYNGRLAGNLEWDLNGWPNPSFRSTLRATEIHANQFLAKYFNWVGAAVGEISLNGTFSGRGRSAAQIVPSLVASGNVDASSLKLQATPVMTAIGRALNISGFTGTEVFNDVTLPFRVENERVITDELKLVTDEIRFDASGSFGMDKTLSYSVTATALSDRVPGFLRGVGINFRLTGTTTSPRVEVDLAGTAKPIIVSMISQVEDSLRAVADSALRQKQDTVQKSLQDKITDALKKVLKPNEP